MRDDTQDRVPPQSTSTTKEGTTGREATIGSSEPPAWREKVVVLFCFFISAEWREAAGADSLHTSSSGDGPDASVRRACGLSRGGWIYPVLS